MEPNEPIWETEFEEYRNQAEETFRHPDRVDQLLRKLEETLATVPALGGALSSIPLMASLVKSYMSGEYTDVPVKTIVAIIAAIAYFVAPIDLIPDGIPGIGYLDDAMVVAYCLKLVQSDLDAYKAWRSEYYI